jgi:hypothetical protein
VTDNVFAFLQSLEQYVRAQGNTFNIAPSCERLSFDACENQYPGLGLKADLPVIEATYGSSMGLVPAGDPAGIVLSKQVQFSCVQVGAEF